MGKVSNLAVLPSPCKVLVEVHLEGFPLLEATKVDFLRIPKIRCQISLTIELGIDTTSIISVWLSQRLRHFGWVPSLVETSVVLLGLSVPLLFLEFGGDSLMIGLIDFSDSRVWRRPVL